ncbi:hypothetical protein [uncultured Aeromicrobium sp.]|uniref:hypothetical protein n=1 Tax=uncultured Aeromicrobium sp. TaxID=337820 RepID=UPI0025D80305|nr:hypothetical protein [uncultured Aeromicrobium sp.]
MPTFYDPVADAEEASQALRGLAHASRDFGHPEDAYGVIGDLLGGVRSLQQSIEQIAQRHNRHEGRAFDDAGSQAAGIRDAHRAAEQLFDAATALDTVEERLNAASQTAGRIAWHPTPTTIDTDPVDADAIDAEAVDAGAVGSEAAGAESRWVSVVFLQGDEADSVLWLIDRDGPEAAIEYLAGWDVGEETTNAAMENGYVYDTVPTGALDKEATASVYALTYNHDLGHVGLYRRHPIPPEDRLDAETPAPAPVAPTTAAAEPAVAEGGEGRWVRVASFGRTGTERVTGILAELGHVDAIDHLASWDRGEQSTTEAITRGEVYDTLPATPDDRVLASGPYRMLLNPAAGTVSLLRHTPDTPAPAAPAPAAPARRGPELLRSYSSPGAPPAAPAPKNTTAESGPRGGAKKSAPAARAKRAESAGSWFAHPGVSAVKHDRGLGR